MQTIAYKLILKIKVEQMHSPQNPSPFPTCSGIAAGKGTEPANWHVDIRGCFAGAFRNWREKHRMPLKQIALELDISIATVQAWESGQRFPAVRHFEMIVAFTGLPPCRLLCAMSDKCVPSDCLLAAQNK
jgi:DNA-binding XRE family transcriptional regulator